MTSTPKPNSTILGWCGPTDPAWRSLLDSVPNSLVPNIDILRPCDLTDWINEPTERSQPPKRTHIKQGSNKRLLIACEHRNDPTLTLIEQFLKPKPRSLPKSSNTPPFALVLGEDWQGHRRTFPLPDTLETFYWYEWFDKTLPWILLDPPQTNDRKLNRQANLNPRGELNPRVARILNSNEQLSRHLTTSNSENQLTASLWWILSDQPDTATFWCSLLENFGARTVGSLLNEPHPHIQPDCILLAPQARTPENTTSVQPPQELLKSLTVLREDHPNAFLALISPFPRLSDWTHLHHAGLNAITGYPTSPQGLLSTWLLRNA